MVSSASTTVHGMAESAKSTGMGCVGQALSLHLPVDVDLAGATFLRLHSFGTGTFYFSESAFSGRSE